MDSQTFWRSVFSEADGTGSASRVLTAYLIGIAGACVLFLTIRNGALPGPMELTGLAAFATAPYDVNKIALALGRKPAPVAASEVSISKTKE